MTKKALLIFTRNPEYGKVKTRLAKTIGKKKALEIYKFLLDHTVSVTQELEADKFVYYSQSIQKNDIWIEPTYQKKLQLGEDLGIRMRNAFKDAFKVGYEYAVIIGSDMYDITKEHIEEAFNQLKTHDVVIGPADDGGYYLLGLKKSIPKIFENKKWGTQTVLQDTLKQLNNYNIQMLERLNDIDVYEDIEHHPAFEQFLKPLNQ